MVRMARENPTWGYTRLRGVLKNLGHELGRNTIKRVLADHGIAPAPERGKSMSWSTFIKAHGGAIAATDLFTVEVVNPFGLVRYHLLFVIDIATRCVCIGGMTSDPNGEWMKQVTRNLTDSARLPTLVLARPLSPVKRPSPLPSRGRPRAGRPAACRDGPAQDVPPIDTGPANREYRP